LTFSLRVIATAISDVMRVEKLLKTEDLHRAGEYLNAYKYQCNRG
jgi:hypothetical protein